MARYLVTGGCGFIGSHLVDALVATGHAVRILDDLSTGKRENVTVPVEIERGDVGDGEVVDRAARGVDGIFHLAAVASVQRSNEDWRGTHRANLTGSVNVFEAARRARSGSAVPVVYASSAAVYGDPDTSPIDEDVTARPLTAYGADKLGTELHARVATRVHGIPTTGLRFFNVYGPRQDPSSPYSGVISIFARRVQIPETIDVMGDGQQVRDFVHVSDVVRFLLAGMARRSDAPGVFNVCTGRATTILDLASLVMSLAGRRTDIRHMPPRAGDIRRSVGDPRRAREVLGESARVPLEEGLANTLLVTSLAMSHVFRGKYVP